MPETAPDELNAPDAGRPFAITRLGTIMAPERDNPLEAEGVLNPAAARGRDGALYLFPRLVAKGNYSRIGLARVRFNAAGDPASVERLGVALEPREAYEQNSLTGGGVEDPRITYFEPGDCYVMTYTAYSPEGPRVALATSKDLFSWQRLGLVRFTAGPLDLNAVDNKDAVLFPRLIPDPEGRPALGLIHRPRFPGSMLLRFVAGIGVQRPSQTTADPADAVPALRELATAVAHGARRLNHESIWMSYAAPDALDGGLLFSRHRRVMSPRARWERIKVGVGTPPLEASGGWVLLYHGVGGQGQSAVRYSAGAMVLDAKHPEVLRYRSGRAVLAPGVEERTGLVPDVVFPTGVDRRGDLGQPDRLDVYFGAADDRIGVGTLHLPPELPASQWRTATGGDEQAA